MRHFEILKSRLRQIRRDELESGQALVETAFTMSLLIVMLLGAVQMGLLSYAAIEVANSAKAAAQYGAQNPGTSVDSATMQTLAVNEAKDYGINLNTPISVTHTPGCAKAGAVTAGTAGCTAGGGYVVQTISVSTSASVTPLIRLPGLGPTFTVYGSDVQEVLF
jgi:Flp pilus assembly protein TadG